MSDALVAAGLRKWFGSGAGRVVPIDGVDLLISRGELVVLTGPSGSGKSTLLQMLAGFQQPDEGRVQWAGCAAGPPPWDVVAVVPQSLGLLPELTAGENVALPLLAGGPGRSVSIDAVAARVRAVMEQLGVAHLADRLAGEASLGQQQRVAVARAVIGTPALLVADEPTSHQDDLHAMLVLDALRRAVAAGAGCIVAGHDPRLSAAADRVVRVELGKLAQPRPGKPA